MFYVYVLQSNKNKQLYVGRTDNLQKRIKQHQDRKTFTTNRLNPMTLVFYESFFDKKDAIRRERYLKTSKGKSSLRMMLRYSLQ